MPQGEAQSEWLTRKQRIDPILDALGWRRAEAMRGAYRIEEYGTDAGPADYALCFDADVLGIVEAKKLSLGPQNVLTQSDGKRVGRAFDTLVAGKTFTAAQQQWLDRIRAHLVENLSIDREDFDVSPVLERAGGWSAADRVFEGKLAQVLREVNEAVSA